MSLSEIAERQDISLAYLEQLFVKLRRAEIVEFGARPGRRLPAGAAGRADPHFRDPGGGRRDHGRAGPRRRGARGGAGGTREQELADKLWEQLSANVYVMLHQTRLGDVVKNQLAPCPAVPAFVEVVDEADG